MPLVERARVETVLPEMADAVAARVEVQRVSAVRATQGNPERLRLVGNRHQVDVVLHQAVSQNARTGLGAVRRKTFQIRAPIGVREKDTLPVHSALRDVVRHPHRNSPRESAHLLIQWAWSNRFLTSYHISPSPEVAGSCLDLLFRTINCTKYTWTTTNSGGEVIQHSSERVCQ
jgi:hypothetical protein